MANFLKLLFAPLTVLGFLWFTVKSAFHTGEIFAQEYLLEVFDEDDED